MDLDYPEHKHPHGIEDTKPNSKRIWVCDECDCAFTDDELRADDKEAFGHFCKQNPQMKVRCESHLEPYMPNYSILKLNP